MWPIYFMLVYYAGIYLFLATAAYVWISVVAGRNLLGKRLFLAILAFGFSALLGYIVAGAVASLRTGPRAIVEPDRVVIVTAYILAGLIGAWVSWKIFKPST